MVLQVFLDAVELQSANDARACDRHTIDDVGISGSVLMDHAGRAVADLAMTMRTHNGPVLVVAGAGNNGGDAYVAARFLLGRGVAVHVVSTTAPSSLKGDARAACEMFHRAMAVGLSDDVPSPRSFVVDNESDVDGAWPLEQPSVVIDGLFGTGLSRPASGVAHRLIERINSVGAPVLAVDVPSGLPSDGQAPTGVVVAATETITFARAKIAHVSEPGSFQCGRVTVFDIGLFHPQKTRAHTVQHLRTGALDDDDDANRAHKGRFGHVGVLVGATATEGAAHLAAHAALRAGAGLVTLIGAPFRTMAPEFMVLDDEAALETFAFTALVVGPGLSSTEAALDRARTFLELASRKDVPVVVDADALTLLNRAPTNLRAVATPHPGEAARALSTTSAEVQRDRLAAHHRLVDLWPAATVVILKGACPVVGDGGESTFIVDGPAPALAVAGSGDSLAGLIGALLARGVTPLDAACLAVVVHRDAGRALASDAPRGHTPSEIANQYPQLLARPSSTSARS